MKIEIKKELLILKSCKPNIITCKLMSNNITQCQKEFNKSNKQDVYNLTFIIFQAGSLTGYQLTG